MNGTFDTIVSLFQAASAPLFARVYGPMRGLFLVLFAIDFSWETGLSLLNNSADFWARILRKLILFAVLWGLLITAPFWLSTLIDGFTQLSKDLTGLSGLSPSAVLSQGIHLFFVMFTAWKGIASALNPVALFLRLFTGIALLIAFTLIAAALLRVLIEAALALGGLAFFLAFLGHKLTWGLAEGYLVYLIELGTRIFVLYLLVGIGSGLADIWTIQLENAPALSIFFDPRLFLAIPLSAAVWASMVLILPGSIARQIASRLSMTALNPMGRAGQAH